MRSLPAVALAAALLVVAAPARAQDEGDDVIVTLKSGKIVRGKLTSRSTGAVWVMVGGEETAVAASTIDRIEKDPDPPASSAPAPRKPAPAPGPAPAPSPAPASAPKGGKAPEPAVLTMADGSKIRGYIVKKEDGTYWIVKGDPRPVAASDVQKVEGEQPAPDGGVGAKLFSGSTRDRSFALVEELASGDDLRVGSAASALESLGAAAQEALLAGLKHKSVAVRQICVGLALKFKLNGAEAALIDLLEKDQEPAVRGAVAGGFYGMPSPLAAKALMVSVGRDRSDQVKDSALQSLSAFATAAEAPGLMDLFGVLPSDSPCRANLFKALRRATGKELADDMEVWHKWWVEEGGREEIETRIREAAEREAQGPMTGEELERR